MHIKPGINHLSIIAKSSECSFMLIQSEKKIIKIINEILIEAFIINEEDAIADFSFSSLFEVTYIICAFFNNPLFVDSKSVIIVRNNAQVPISAFVNCLINTIKFVNPKIKSENL